jgi:hypothetical protein
MLTFIVIAILLYPFLTFCLSILRCFFVSFFFSPPLKLVVFFVSFSLLHQFGNEIFIP